MENNINNWNRGGYMNQLRTSVVIFLLMLFSLPAWATTQVFIPHLTGGDNQWGDFLTIDNTGLEPADVVVTLYDIDGYQVYRGWHSVGSLGETLIDIRQLTEAASSGKVEFAEDGYIHCRLSLESYVGGGVAEFRLDSSQSSDLAFLYSDFPGLTVWKGLAVANYGDIAGEITFYAYGNGELLGKSEPQKIASHEKLVGVTSHWFPEIDSHMVKKIIAVSTINMLGGLAIAGDVAIERLLFTAAVPLDGFTPPGVIVPDKTLTGIWKGSWVSNYYGDWGTMVIRMTQNGNKIVASADFYETICGNVKNIKVVGTVTDNKVAINASYWCGPYSSTLTAQGSFDDNSINAVYQLKAPAASYYDSGSLKLVRQ